MQNRVNHSSRPYILEVKCGPSGVVVWRVFGQVSACKHRFGFINHRYMTRLVGVNGKVSG